MNMRKFFIGLVFLLCVVGAVIFFVMIHQKYCLSCLVENGESVRHYIESFGSLAIVVYVLLYALNTVILVPPIAFMSLSAGVIFGAVWGMIALSLGAFLGTTITFMISRFMGGRYVDRFVKGRAERFNERLAKSGFVVLLPMRLIGFPPYEFVNYACGLSKITYKDYISATMLGMMPAIVIQVLLADRLTNFSWQDPVLYGAVIMFIAMGIITGKIIKKRKEKEDDGCKLG